MSYLANGHLDTLPVPGDESATVTFRSAATWADEKRLTRRTRELSPSTEPEDRAYAFRVARTLLMVESWTLTDALGEPLPLTPEVLESGLSRQVAAWIDKEAERRFEGRSEEDEGPFAGSSRQPSTAKT